MTNNGISNEKEKMVIIERLFKNPHVKGDLDLSECTSLTSLPEGLRVEGSLNLSGCTSLTSLPENLYVKENLWLNGCTGLTNLPDSLYVGGLLELAGCTGLGDLSTRRATELEYNKYCCKAFK